MSRPEILKAGQELRVAKTQDELELIESVKKGDLEKIRELDKKGVSFDLVYDDYENSLMHLAAENGHVDVIIFLKESKKFDVNARDKLERTPLHFAVIKGRIEVIKTLARLEADVNAKDKYLHTPLHLAVRGISQIEAVRALVAAGADPNVQEKYGSTPLHYAVGIIQIEPTRIVLGPKVEVNAKDEATKILLLAGADINAKSKYGQTPLSLSLTVLEERHYKNVYIKEYGEDIVPLFFASEETKVLLEKYEAPIGQISTIIRNAETESSKIDQIKAVLEVAKKEGLSVRAILNSSMDDNQNKLIHHAVRSGLEKLAEFLLFQGADPKARDKEGKTALDGLPQVAASEQAGRMQKIFEQVLKPQDSMNNIQDALQGIDEARKKTDEMPAFPKGVLSIIQDYASYQETAATAAAPASKTPQAEISQAQVKSLQPAATTKGK